MRYKVIAQKDGVEIKPERMEVNDKGEIYAIWYKNERGNITWSFIKDLSEFVIVGIAG